MRSLPEGYCMYKFTKIIHIVIIIIFYIQHTIHTEIIEKIDEKGMNFSGGLVPRHYYTFYISSISLSLYI